MAAQASGQEITIKSGDYQARIVTAGAGLAALTHQGVDIVLPHSVDEVAIGYQGKTLLPWPNRIFDGRYTWQGQEFEVPVNDTTYNSALHGLLMWTDWNIIHSDSDSTTLGVTLPAQPSYPWILQCWVTYAIHADTGLSISVGAKNLSTQPAPFGISHHPYLTIDQKDNAGFIVSVPANSVLGAGEDKRPSGIVPVADTGLDLRKPVVIGDRQIDHAFTDLPGAWVARISDPESGRFVDLSSSAPWAQVFTADGVGRSSIAVEPMTCAPDAFNNGYGLIELAPGEAKELSFTISSGIDA